jgi:nucleoside-diphosphate-sugar epimerase
MKILITGASGFVGGALWQRCRELGWEVRASGRRKLPNPDYQVCDLVTGFDSDFRPDVVVHAAARSSPWGSRRQFEDQNIQATRSVIDFCSRHGQPHLIYVSTAAVLYRGEHQFGLDEETPPPSDAINVYAETKLAAEAEIRGYTGTWCILRPRAVFGPGDTVIFPRILRAVKRGRFPLIETGQAVWADLVYIDTLVEYLVTAAMRRVTGLYHVTNGEPVEILPFFTDVFTKMGLPLPTRRMKVERALQLAKWAERLYLALPFLGEPPITVFGVSVFAYSKTFNVAKALRDLGPPAVSLATGVDRYVRFQNFNGLKTR